MPLRKQAGNMYPFVTHTWNPIKGKCSHDCVYCYMKRFPQKPIRLDERELKTDLGKDNYIFVGSSTDMFAQDVPESWIMDVITRCSIAWPWNDYLFQSKNPLRFYDFNEWFPQFVVLGTTIETNRLNYDLYSKNTPDVYARSAALSTWRGGKMVTIEPIIDFDLGAMMALVMRCNPKWVNIGADSQGHNLPEPPAGKVRELIEELGKFTEVKLKANLKRLFA